MIVCRDRADAIEALTGGDGRRAFSGHAGDTGPACVFLFSGQGAQYAGMARALYRTEAVFRAEVDACCAVLGASGGPDLRAVLIEDGGMAAVAAALRETAVTQPALFVTEYALARCGGRGGWSRSR